MSNKDPIDTTQSNKGAAEGTRDAIIEMIDRHVEGAAKRMVPRLIGAMAEGIQQGILAEDLDLPACCRPVGTSLAEVLYCTYQMGGPAKRAGLAWDGRPCPTWEQLVVRAEAGDEGAQGVIAKWESTAQIIDKLLTDTFSQGLTKFLRLKHLDEG